MTNKVQIDIIAKDLASAALDVVSRKLMAIGGSAGTIATGFLAVGAAVVAGLGKATVQAQKYDQEVKDMMVTTGGTAEATSRLIQTVDDAGISYDALKRSMQFAVKKGIEPNIDALGDLSDAYLRLAPGVARGQFLIKNFGQNSFEMARLMELGSNSIEKMSRNTEIGLILTDKAIKQSEEYRKNTDNLKDSWDGFVVSTGNKVIPVLNTIVQKNKDWADSLDELGFSSVAVISEQQKAAVQLDVDRKARIRATQATAEHQEALDGVAQAYTQIEQHIDSVATLTDKSIVQTIFDSAKATDQYAAAISELDLALSKGKITQEAYTAGIKKAGDEYESTTNMMTFGLIQAALAMDGLQESDTAALLNAGVQLGVLTQASADSAQVMIDNAMAVGAANTRMVESTAAGVPKASAAFDRLTQELNSGKITAAQYTAAVNALILSLGKLNGSSAVAYIDVIINGKKVGNTGTQAPLAVPQGSHAEGLDTVPNDNYLANLHKGETVLNEKAANAWRSGLSGGMTVNLTYAPAFSTANKDEFVQNITPMLNAWYRQRLTS